MTDLFLKPENDVDLTSYQCGSHEEKMSSIYFQCQRLRSHVQIWCCAYEHNRGKERDLILTYDKIPYTNWKQIKSTWQHKTPPKCFITAVWVRIAHLLVWLNCIRAQLSHCLQQPCNQKDKHKKNVNNPLSLYIIYKMIKNQLFIQTSQIFRSFL